MYNSLWYVGSIICKFSLLLDSVAESTEVTNHSCMGVLRRVQGCRTFCVVLATTYACPSVRALVPDVPCMVCTTLRLFLK